MHAPETNYAYDAAGQLLSTTDPLSNVTAYEYDSLGRLIEQTGPDPDGEGPLESPVTTYAYDAAGNLASVADPLGKLAVQEEKIARPENKLQKKNEVISELMEENVRAKKSIGEL